MSSATTTTQSPYETGCPGCGSQFLFKEPLTDWTTVFCGRCNGFVRVR